MRFKGRRFKSDNKTFLLSYRNTSHSTTGEIPAKLSLERNFHTRLDLLKPVASAHVNESRMKQALTDSRKFREFEIGRNVLARYYRPTSNEKWITGSIVERKVLLTYKIGHCHGNI